MLDIFASDYSAGQVRALPSRDTGRLMDPSGYLPGEGLMNAVNIAIALSQPLLVSGEPGTGKTLLGYNVAWRLGLDAPFVYSAKSDTFAKDLYYRFDTLARFHDAQTARTFDPLHYVMLNALGMALVLTLPREATPSGLNVLVPDDRPRPRRSVVIIDEIDKAPRDVPNDMLYELEGMFFQLPEVGLTISGDPMLLPIVIFTSNSERSLPDAFLRRCIYYHIPFPSEHELRRIAISRTGLFTEGSGKLLDECLAVFWRSRSTETGLRKRPTTAELLAWLRILEMSGANRDSSLSEISGWQNMCIATLAKTAEDQYVLSGILSETR